MKHTFKRLTAIFLTLCMLLSVLPLGAFATSDPESYVFDISEGNVTVADGETSGKIKVEYGGGLTTEEFDPSQVITVTGTVSGGSLVIDTATPVTIQASNLTINNGYNDYMSPMYLRNGAANVTLVLEGENLIVGGRDQAGIVVETGRTLTITGTGSLEARSEDHNWWYTPSSGAGIGGRVHNSCGTVIIESGTVTATGGTYAAGIGGGGRYGNSNTAGNGGNVTIYGGTVTATGNGGAADIGGGKDTVDTGTLTVDGDAWVTAANIGGTKTLTRGVVNGTVYGDITLTEDLTVDNLTIAVGATLTVPDGVTLTIDDALVNTGTLSINGPEGVNLTANGKLYNSGTLFVNDPECIVGTGTLTGNLAKSRVPFISVNEDLVETGEELDPHATVTAFSTLGRPVQIYNGGGKYGLYAKGWGEPTYSPAPVKAAGEYTVSFTLEDVTVSKTFTVDCELDFAEDNMGSTIRVTYNTVLGEVPASDREGYTFDGWFTEGGEKYDPTAPVIHSATYYARYTPNVYTITYGDETMDVTFGEPFTVPAAPALADGEVFYAWLGSDGNIYLAGETYTYTYPDHLTLTALIDRDTDTDTTYWTVKFIGEDGYLFRVELVEQTEDAAVTMPVYWNYAQATWTCGGVEYNANETVPVTGDMTFTVNAAELHTVRFVADGYLVSEQQVRDGDMVQYVPAVPEKDGYDGEWSVDLDVFGAFITGDMTVTAVYTAKQYKVMYFGTGFSGVPTTQTVTYGKTFFVQPYTGNVPDGMTFYGWVSKQGDVFLQTTTSVYDYAGDLSLAPLFDKNTKYWTVKLVGEDGAIYDVELVEQKSDAKVTLPAYAEYPDATWTLDNSDAIVEYNAGSVVPITGDTIFTVKAPAKYTVTFIANGYLVAQYTVRDGETLPEIPAVPAKTGYDGVWDTDLNGTAITGDQIVTADYTAKQYKVMYFGTGFSGAPSTQTVTYGKTFFVQPYTGNVPDGMTFYGWVSKEGDVFLPTTTPTYRYESNLSLAPLFDKDTKYWTVKLVGEDGAIYDVELVEQKSDAKVTLPEYTEYPDATWTLNGSDDAADYGAGSVVPITGDTTFTVKAPAKHTVTFRAQGYLVAQYTVRDGETLAEIPAVPGKTGYSGKWDTSLNGVAITGDLTVTAVYTAIMRSIPYRMNEHDTTDLASQQVRFDGYFQPLEYTWDVPDGQSFLGWRGTDGNFYVPGTTYRMTCDYTLIMTPVFEDNTEYWTVKFIGESGYLYDVALVEKTSDATVALPTYAPYADATWTLGDDEYAAGEAVPITGDTTFTVKAPALYTVTFMANGYLVAQYTVRDGETLPEVPTVPEKYGYTGEWDADTDAAITEDTVIEAAYTANEYTIYYHDETGEVYYEEDVTFGDWFTPVAFEGTVPDGMKFLGWNGDDGQFFLAGKLQRLSVASDLYLLPVFDSDTEYWTVKFCHPDGSLENVYLVEQAAIEGTEFFIADKEYSLYPDAEWMLTSGTVDEVAVGEIVSTNYITIRSDVVFTAVVPDTYTILFCSEEGYLMDVRFIMENELIGAGPVAPAKEGYTFVGWQDENGDLLTDDTVATQDTVYTPVYEKNLYPIILVPSEHVQLGVLPESAQAGVGDIITIGTAAEVGYETYCVCVYYQNAGELVPVAITPMPSNDPYDSPDMNGYTFVMPAGPVAVWVIEEANRNTAKFLVDGAIYGLEYILSGEAPAAPAEPVKEGYTFLGWKALSTGKEYPVGTEFDPIYADETYVALFEINTYDLTYYRGAEADASEYKCILALPDGTFVEFFNNDTTNMPTYVVADVTYNDTVVLAEPMLPGYVFKGWVDENGYMHPAGAKYTMPASDVLLTAVWEEDTELSCLVRFMNGGELYDAYLAYDGQDASIPAVDPTADGKLFKGWKYGENTYSNTGVKDFIVVASDAREMTFEAVWEDILYTVTYTDYETFTDIAYGTELVTLAAPEREGYTFVAWQCAENGAYYFANTAFTVKGDMTFTAVWAKNDVEYTVKFFDENGNLVDIFVAEEDAELTAPVYEQGRDDAEYVWVDAEHNTYLHEGESFNATADCSYRATLIDEAQYPILILVESDDGEVDNVATADKNEYFLGETVYVEITVPEGYVLKAVSAVGAGNELLPIKDSLLPMGGEDYLYIFEMPAAPVVVLVELEKIPAGYTAVKFVNDGDLYDYMIVQKGSNAYAPETAPVKDGYTFIEWRSESSFVAPGGEFAVPAEAGSEIVYTAVWEAIDYMVEYRPDGGIPDPEDVHELHYGDKITLADAPVKGGYVFIGWVEESTGFLYGAGCTYTVTGDAVFTAKWEQAECVVRFLDPSSGIIYGYEALKQGEQVTAPAAPIVSGKTFLYWVNAEDDTDRVFAGAMTPALYTDTVYHAVFETSKHNISVSTEHCAVSPASFGAKEVGELIEFTVTPDADYALKLVTVSYFDGTSFVVRELTADESGVYSFYMPDAEVTITAKAVQNVYSIFTSSDAHTLIQVVNGNKAAVGETVLFTVEVTDENYEPNNVIVSTASGKPIALSVIHIEGTFFAYAFTMPAEDVTIYADAAQGERTVTFLDSDNTLLGIVPVGAGDYVTDAPIAAREGYTFAGWERLPEKTPYDPERDAVTENLIVRATYVGDAHTVAAGLIENVYALRAECTVSSGNVNSSDLLQTALNAETGKTVYFTVAANYDYVITDIAVVSAEGTNLVVEPTLREKKTEDNIVYYTYSFTMPAENVMIDVYTAPKLFTTTVVENIPEGGTYTINGFYTSNLWIPQGETVTIDITPAEGYIVKNVYGEFTDNFSQISKVDGTLDGNTFTFPMVAKDVVVYIEYEAIVYGIDIETSNFATYKPDASVNPAKVVESLDPALTSQGIIRIVDGETRDYTNELEQVYKIPANGEATNGTRVAFTVEEFTGYDLVSVTVTYDNGEKSCMLTYKDGVYYFDMPADDVVITAVFTEETYKVSKDAASEAHGEVVINGLTENIVSADYKDEITVTVTPDDGWQISKIYYVLADGTVLDFDAASYTADAALTDALDTAHSITFHMPASDVTVYVEYVAIDYTVNVEKQEAEVEVFYSPSNVGEQVNFEVTANYGYIISKVYVTDDTTGERVYHHTASTNQLYGAWYTFTMPASSVTIHVETVKDEYNVKYLDNGALIAYENIEYMDTANVAAHVEKVVNGKAGYHFVGWVSSDVETPVTDPSVTDADFVVVKDTFIYAAYERDEIDVLFKATEHGTVTELSTGNTAEYRLDTTVFGDTVEFTAVPDVGYVVDTVSVTTTNGEGYNLDIRYTEQDGKYTFVIPASYKDNIHVVQAEDVIVTVTFKKDAYTLTKADDCGTNGTIAVNGAVTTQTSFTYEYQDEVTITATPDNGYYVVSVTAQNADGSTVYSVTGEKPATDTPVGDSLTLTFAMPAEDLTYTVIYAKIDYSITTVFDATQGSVATEPVGTAQLDDIVTVTVTPVEGYELAELTVTYAGGEKSCVLTEIEENVYTFTMPADAVVVTAIFTEITYTANLTIVGEGSGTLNGYYTDNMPADYLDTVTVTAAPAEGWELVSIEVDGGKIEVNEEIKPEGGAYTFTMPSHDVEIIVTFEKTGYGLDSYALNFFEQGHGTVTLDPETTAYVGDRVIISADPDDGYRVKSVTVIDEYGYAVPVSFINGTPGYVETWSFTMPAASVDIYVVFEVQGASYYVDVRTDHWFYEAVTFVTDRGYFYGISEELFAPNMNMNRAMFVTVLGRISGVDVTEYTGIAFTDVEAGSYYAPYVAWAAENGIVLGRDAETFDPYANITREEMAAIMYRYCDFLGMDMTPENEVFMDRYVDRDDISDWAVTYVEWAVGIGLIRGMSDNTIDPLSYATRAQVAQVIKNLCDKVLYK